MGEHPVQGGGADTPPWIRAVLLALLLTITACSTPSVPSVPAPAPSPLVYGTDLAWAQLTLALNQRALQILSLVPDRAADTRLVSLAHGLQSGHSNENAQLLALLDRIGAPAENPHTNHDMPGMATAEELAALSAARADAFDRLFVASLRKHLTQCENLAHSMSQAGRLPEALALAATIESARRQSLAALMENFHQILP